MRKFSFLLLSVCLPFLVFAGGAREKKDIPDLVIYTYDSFVSEWGPGPQVLARFEEATGLKVRLESAGDAGQILARAILEKKNPKADIVLGLDNNLLAAALDADILESFSAGNLDKIPGELIFDKTAHLTPYDYGFFSIIYDSHRISEPPGNLEDLTREEYRKSIILMDPRTSSPGFGFLLWTIVVYGDDYLDYWERLKPSILTITDGWDSGYGLFTEGEAPMVLSYTTSPAYHVEFEETDRYRALIFEEGNYMQIEGAGILKGARNRKNAELFLEFMLSEAFQEVIPLTNFMFPVNSDTLLPASFEYALKPEKILLLDAEDIRKNQDTWIQKWVETISW